MTSPTGAGDGGEMAHGRLWLAETLWKLGCVQFGDFSLGRTVRNSPVYLNPKLLISQPEALQRTIGLIVEELEMAMAMRNRQVEPYDVIAGVPIGGLHLATALSLHSRRPMLYLRPSRQQGEPEPPHIEGIYLPGQTAIIVDDLAAGGGSLVETVEGLRQVGLTVRDAVVLIDREQGAHRRLEELGVRLHPMLTMEVLLTHLHSGKRLQTAQYDRAMSYFRREGEPRSEFD